MQRIQKKRIGVAICLLAVAALLSGFALFQACQNNRSLLGRVTRDMVSYPEITVTSDGTITHEGKTISEDYVIALLRGEVDQADGDAVSTKQHRIIIVNSADDVPYGYVRKVKNLIIKHGGAPGSTLPKEDVEIIGPIE